MNTERIAVIIQRVLMMRFFRFEQLLDFVFWPTIDILIWGGVGKALVASAHDESAMVTMLAGVIVWRVFVYTQLDISFTFLTELQSRNLTNLFVSPLSLGEWMLGLMLGGVGSALGLLMFSALIAWLAYGIFLFKLGPVLMWLFFMMVVCGWGVGFVAATTALIYGTQAERFVRILSWAFVPFAGVYYPLETMPVWIQKVATCIPMSYLVESFRVYIEQGARLPSTHVLQTAFIGMVLSVLFAMGGAALFVSTFTHVRRQGLMRLEIS